MTAAKKRGRPRAAATRREQFNFRLQPGDRERIAKVAAWAHREPSEWARVTLMRAVEDAERVIGDTPETAAAKARAAMATIELLLGALERPKSRGE